MSNHKDYWTDEYVEKLHNEIKELKELQEELTYWRQGGNDEFIRRDLVLKNKEIKKLVALLTYNIGVNLYEQMLAKDKQIEELREGNRLHLQDRRKFADDQIERDKEITKLKEELMNCRSILQAEHYSTDSIDNLLN